MSRNKLHWYLPEAGQPSPFILGLFLATLVILVAGPGGILPGPASAQMDPHYSSKRLEKPRSALNQPFDDQVYVGLFGQLGGAFKYDQGTFGYGGMVVFRPGKAANFLPALYDWNASLVLQADYLHVSGENRIFSGDIIVRPYFHDMRDPATKYSPFFGVGIGGSEVQLPPDAEERFHKSWSWLVEIGQEWNHKQGYLLQVKGQYRRYNSGGYDFTCWSVQAGAGIPLPW